MFCFAFHFALVRPTFFLAVADGSRNRRSSSSLGQSEAVQATVAVAAAVRAVVVAQSQSDRSGSTIRAKLQTVDRATVLRGVGAAQADACSSGNPGSGVQALQLSCRVFGLGVLRFQGCRVQVWADGRCFLSLLRCCSARRCERFHHAYHWPCYHYVCYGELLLVVLLDASARCCIYL